MTFVFIFLNFILQLGIKIEDRLDKATEFQLSIKA